MVHVFFSDGWTSVTQLRILVFPQKVFTSPPGEVFLASNI